MEGFNNSCNETFTFNVTSEADALSLQYTLTECIIIKWLLPCVLLLGLLGNCAFLLVFLRVQWMRTVTNAYLANIAVADIVFLIIGVGEKGFRYATSPIAGDQTILRSSGGCVFLYLILDITYFASMFLVTFVSYERYLAVCDPLQYRVVTLHFKYRTLRNLLTAWMLGLAFAAATIPGRNVYVSICVTWPTDDINKYRAFPTKMGLCTAMSEKATHIVNGIQTLPFFVTLIINTVLYTTIIRRLNPKNSSARKCAPSRNNVRNQVAVMLVITGVVFFVCLAPFEILSMLYMIAGFVPAFTLGHIRMPALVQFSRVLMYINSAINAVIYNMASCRYRKAFGIILQDLCFPQRFPQRVIINRTPDSLRKMIDPQRKAVAIWFVHDHMEKIKSVC